jgi:hypothetical protein
MPELAGMFKGECGGADVAATVVERLTSASCNPRQLRVSTDTVEKVGWLTGQHGWVVRL